VYRGEQDGKCLNLRLHPQNIIYNGLCKNPTFQQGDLPVKPWCFILISLFLLTFGCSNLVGPISNETSLSITLSAGELYVFHTGMSGDEEGASIVVQTKHFTVSEITRNAGTMWEPVYTYTPEDGYAGTDYIELETISCSDGTDLTKKVGSMKISFKVQ
jgi:hypothetical protein